MATYNVENGAPGGPGIINVGDVVIVNGDKKSIDAYPEGMNFGMVIAISFWRGQEYYIMKNPLGVDGSRIVFCRKQDITAVAFSRMDDDSLSFANGQDWSRWLEMVHSQISE